MYAPALRGFPDVYKPSYTVPVKEKVSFNADIRCYFSVRMDGRVPTRVDGEMNGWTNSGMNGWTPTDRWMDGRTDG